MPPIFLLALLLFIPGHSLANDLTYEDELAPGYRDCITHSNSMAEERACLWKAVAHWQQEINAESEKLLNSVTTPQSRRKLQELMETWKKYLDDMTEMAEKSVSGSGASEHAALTNINISRKHYQFLKNLWDSDLVRKYE